MTDSDIIAQLRAAKADMLAALVACSAYVDSRAAEGDGVAAELAHTLKQAQHRNQTAILEAQLSL